MIEESFSVGLVVERRREASEWGGHAWAPVAVLPAAPPVAPWTPLGGSADRMRYFAGPQTIHLYSTDTANYRDNLETGEPKLWVVLRAEGAAEPPIEIAAVTADPAEGEASTEAGSNTVGTVSMPREIAALVAEFIAEHHVERPVIKRRRDKKPPREIWRDGRAPDGEPSKD